MQLIGMLDSPYVRRCAVSLKLLGLPFEHRPVSVFRHFDEFRGINPVVKAPTLVTSDGAVLMDSSLILQYAESLPARTRSLVPASPPAQLRDLRILGLALAACEKSISIVYENNLRPAEKRHDPWLDRVRGQLLAACRDLESELARAALADGSRDITQAGVTTAVAWSFLQLMLPEVVVAGDYPIWQSFAAKAEKLREFTSLPQQ